MAPRGSSKARSIEHEEWIAKEYGGDRSPSSGAYEGDLGDVRNAYDLIECKTTGTPEKPARLPVFIQHLEKISMEGWESGLDAFVALRYFAPDSKLANIDGWVDVIVRHESVDSEIYQCRN